MPWSWSPARVLGFLLAVVLVAACRTPPPPDMAALVTQPDGPDLAYVLTLEPEEPSVKIEVAFVGDPDGTTELAVADTWGGVDDPERDVHELVVTSNGVALPAGVPVDGVWSIRHPPSAALRATYILKRSAPVTMETASYYRPIVEPGRFHMVGTVGLLYPQHLSTNELVDIDLRWRGFREASYAVASSFSDNPDGFRTRQRLVDFRLSVLLAGDVRLVERPTEAGRLVLAITGDGWGFSDDELADLAAAIVEVERAFFDDQREEFFLVTLVEVGEVSEVALLSGSGLTQSFSLFITPNFGHGTHENEQSRLKFLLAHEYFHNWNGVRIRREQPEEELTWFTEGFTSYYARELLFRAGLMSADEYVEHINETLIRYYRNPERERSATAVLQHFWDNENVRQLPYERGDLVAMLLDEKIREVSDGERSLDDLMRHLLAESDAGKELSPRSLRALIAKWTSEKFATTVDAIIDGRAVAELPADVRPQCLRVVSKNIGVYDIGFDFTASRETHRVTNVRKDSNAFKAGLRNGQELLGWDVVEGRPNRDASFVVKTAKGRRNIVFVPQVDAEPVAQVELDDADACR